MITFLFSVPKIKINSLDVVYYYNHIVLRCIYKNVLLQVLEFTKINMALVKLLRQIILPILLADDESIIISIFSKISKSDDLFVLREGLLIFLHKFVLNNSFGISWRSRNELQFSTIIKRISLVEKVIQK